MTCEESMPSNLTPSEFIALTANVLVPSYRAEVAKRRSDNTLCLELFFNSKGKNWLYNWQSSIWYDFLYYLIVSIFMTLS